MGAVNKGSTETTEEFEEPPLPLPLVKEEGNDSVEETLEEDRDGVERRTRDGDDIEIDLAGVEPAKFCIWSSLL